MCLALCCAGIPALAQLLKTKDEGDVGNAALCLSHCTQVAGVCSSLAQTDIIKETLVRHRWNKTRAAEELGLSRVGLRSKLERYGLERGEADGVAASP